MGPVGHAVAEPGVLPLGVLPGGGDGEIAGAFEGEAAVMGGDELASADDLGGGERWIEIAQRQRLLHRTGFDHRIEALFDALSQKRARHVDDKGGELHVAQQRIARLLLPVAQRLAGGFQHLGGAERALCVADIELVGDLGIAAHEFFEEGLWADVVAALGSGEAGCSRDGGDFGDAIHQHIEIEPSAAGEDRDAMRGARFFQRMPGIGLIAASGIGIGDVDMAVEHVRRDDGVFVGRPRGEDAGFAINLHGIGVDDDTADLPRQLQREPRLAARGGPCNKHGVIRHVISVSGYVLSVVSTSAIRPELVDAIARGDQVTWLSPERAFDVAVAGDEKQALAAARMAAADTAIDINAVRVDGRRKTLLVADMDSTIISCECLDEIADFVGVKAHVSAITERAMRGEIAFEPALRERVALLKGLSVHRLARVYAERVRLNPGAKALVATMKANGARTCLVSGGFTYFTQRVAADAGFDDHQANVLLDDGAALLGTVKDPILGKEAKLAALLAEVKALGINESDALCVGDGANDLAMIERAGLGVAYHAKPVVAGAAGARIDHGDLTALLYLQGYKDSEIVRS